MKRKTSFTSPIKNKSNPDSKGHVEGNSSDDQSLNEAVEKCPDRRIILNQINKKKFILAANDLGFNKSNLMRNHGPLTISHVQRNLFGVV